MDNNNKWSKNKDRSKESSRNDRRRNSGKNGRRRNNRNFKSNRGERNFQKFVDTNHNNKSDYWPRNDWSCDNRSNNYHSNGSGIYPWIRTNPVNPSIKPQHHINFEYNNEYQDESVRSCNVKEQINQKPEDLDEKKSVSTKMNGNNSVHPNNLPEGTETCKLAVEKNCTLKIKQEKDVKNSKQDRKESSPKSSSSECSSSEKELDHINKNVAITPEVATHSQFSFSPREIKPTSENTNPTKKERKLKISPEASSTSFSNEEYKPTVNADKQKPEIIIKKNTKPTKNKNSSEDEVVCIGNMESKIVLEDDSAKEAIEKEKDAGEVDSNLHLRKTEEKCMICDKKGHTSFECQMICKNCSAPYHGYRTCPQPANLNTMLQLFIEFCMQQFQNFKIERQIATHSSVSIAKPQFDSSHLISGNKSNKLKRKFAKANKTKTRIKDFKKRQIATKKTTSKTGSDDGSEDDTDSESTSIESEDAFSDSSAESLFSSKKKRKLKNKNTSKGYPTLPNFSPNTVNLPIALNGFPNLTIPTASVQNPNTSANALNTLLLTQMFQNAIGSMK